MWNTANSLHFQRLILYFQTNPTAVFTDSRISHYQNFQAKPQKWRPNWLWRFKRYKWYCQ